MRQILLGKICQTSIKMQNDAILLCIERLLPSIINKSSDRRANGDILVMAIWSSCFIRSNFPSTYLLHALHTDIEFIWPAYLVITCNKLTSRATWPRQTISFCRSGALSKNINICHSSICFELKLLSNAIDFEVFQQNITLSPLLLKIWKNL